MGGEVAISSIVGIGIWGLIGRVLEALYVVVLVHSANYVLVPYLHVLVRVFREAFDRNSLGKVASIRSWHIVELDCLL